MHTRNLLKYVLCSVLITTIAPAKIWRVDNNGGAPSDFETLQAAAISAEVLSGDTLYVYGSPITYGYMHFNKKLTIIGPGYFLNQNPETQAYPAVAIAADIQFNAGSDSSLITGLTTDWILVNADFIAIKRMRIHSSYSEGSIFLQTGASSISIQQSYITNNYGYSHAEGIKLNGDNTAVIISNNYIDVSTAGAEAIWSATSSNPQISHNVISGDLTLYAAQVENNILTDVAATITGDNTTRFLNNMCAADQLPDSLGNQLNVDMANVFKDTGSTDGRWQLVAGSLAIGAGLEGTDMGMFGGPSAYVLSGLPSIPHIYYLTVPSAAQPGSPLQVRVKAKTNN
ncbi:hypothetical protein ACFL6E_03030 [Candidatus Neomarinimicrobiota bacterium]